MRPLLLSAATLATLGAATASHAAISADDVVAAICLQPEQAFTREDLAEAIVGEARILPSTLAQAYPGLTAKDTGNAAVEILWDGGKLSPMNPAVLNARSLAQELELRVAKGSPLTAKEAGFSVQGSGPGRGWLFKPGATYQLKCAPGKPPKTIVQVIDEETAPPVIAITGKVEDLGVIGKDRKSIDAAKIGFKREKTWQDDGSRKTDTTETFDGTIGLRLSPNSVVGPVYAFGSYAKSEARAKPAKPLDPGKSVDDDDTNAFEYGLSVGLFPLKDSGDWSLWADGQISEVNDYVKDSRRLRLRMAFTPGVLASLGGLCRLGEFNDGIGESEYRGRCTLRVEIEGSHVIDVGTADFKRHGEFLAIGARLGYDLAAPMGDDAAVIGSVAYRYLPVISGRAPDIHRLDASIKYRLWLDRGLGLDFGLTYANGRESKTYKDEDKLEVGLGVVF